MATIREVAALAGVSLSTVSIVINGQAAERKITDATCQKVWDAVEKLHYQPNIAARKLRAPDMGTLTIALYWANDFRTTLLNRFLQGMQRELTARPDIELMVVTYPSGGLCRQPSLREGRRFHGAIIANASEEDIAFLEEQKFSFPMVLYNRESVHYSFVTVDERKMGRLAAEKLLSFGHRNICVLSSPHKFPYMRERDEGLKAAYAEAGYPIYESRLIETESSLAGGAAACRRILDGAVPCTALYCSSDAIALGALRTLYDRGLKVPEQMSVLSIGNGEPAYAAYAIPALSNIYLPMESMAERCLQLALKQIAAHGGGNEQVYLDTPVYLRESLGPAPKR